MRTHVLNKSTVARIHSGGAMISRPVISLDAVTTLWKFVPVVDQWSESIIGYIGLSVWGWSALDKDLKDVGYFPERHSALKELRDRHRLGGTT